MRAPKIVAITAGTSTVPRSRKVTLLAQQFDPVALSTEGDPLPLLRDVGQNAIIMNASFSTSTNGVLGYLGARQAGTE